ncbi:phosphatidylserine lipase ABHD16A-like isoform X2 [Gordionus sp. m RMFG-2023]|uniref:phosphatidylserine lipase ABHD16A-like isoform X2 n=1 Tax=Gordionus sp. m RMFG-2023 TaxID=3053472 RepID=UPI0031FE1745
MAQLLRYVLSPQLYSIISKPDYYTPNFLEDSGNITLRIIAILKSLTMYSSPIILLFIQRNGYYKKNHAYVYLKITFILFCILTFGNLLRGAGRLLNSEYLNFLKLYDIYQRSKDAHERTAFLKMYDFDTRSWNPDYVITEKPDIKSHFSRKDESDEEYRGTLPNWKRIPFNILSYLATHSFALKMAYPGYTSIMNFLLGNSLIDGRYNLLTRHKGQRAKIRVYNGEDVDTMFIDKRGNPAKTMGEYLMIVCEGNASYYEVGCLHSFLDTGLSLLSWNHPGFGASTGEPFPQTELTFIDGVVKYALNVLKFQESKLIFYSWSIGCFSASWASMRYHGNKALILDAAFDDILPLAINRMPTAIENLVTFTIRKYIDLRTLQFLIKNPSKNIIFIRRTQDEIMNMIDGDVSSNRINNLVLKIFKYRYPHVFTSDVLCAVRSVLCNQTDSQNAVTSTVYKGSFSTLTPDLAQLNGNLYSIGEFPSPLGTDLRKEQKLDFALDLVRKYLFDYQGSHCEPIPKHFYINIISKLLEPESLQTI